MYGLWKEREMVTGDSEDRQLQEVKVRRTGSGWRDYGKG